MRTWHEEHIYIMLEWEFDRIGNNLKTNEYILIKFGQYMAKSHNVEGHVLFIQQYSQNFYIFYI